MEVDLQLIGTIPAFNDADFEVDLRVVGGPFSLIIKTDSSFTLEQIYQAISDQLNSCFGISLPTIPDGPWSALFDQTHIRPSVWITPSEADGISAYLNLEFDPVVKIGGESMIGPVKVELTPNFTVSALMIGYNAKTGLDLSARVTYPTQGGSQSSVQQLARGVGAPTGTELVAKSGGEVSKIVEYPFPMPAQGSGSVFTINYLGIGQRVGPEPITDTSVANPLATIFDELEKQFDTNDPKEILTTLAKTFYHPDRNWFIAADISYKSFRFRVLFNDPALYGLEISVGDTPRTFFSGLLFEILYQKLGPSLGVYYGALTLPESMRRIPMNGFVLILPGFSIWVYTNGDFRVNIGWPVGPNSIGVSVDLLTGYAGFFFAKLRSGDNPGAKSGPTYNPILGFGIGFQLEAGVSFNAGVLSASLSVKATTTMQGLIAWLGNGNIDGPPDAYWFAGTFSLQVLIQGSVDFVVIKATVAISFSAQAQVAFENGYQTQVSVSAEVSARASIKVLFITVHFSFSTHVSHTFAIGSGDGLASVNGPLAPGLTGLLGPQDIQARLEMANLMSVASMRTLMQPALRSEREPLRPPRHLDLREAPRSRTAAAFSDTNAGAPFIDELADVTDIPVIDVTFALQTTATYDETGKGALAVVGLLLTEAPDPEAAPNPSPTVGTSFEALTANIVVWLLNTYAPGSEATPLLSSRLRTLQTLLGQGNEEPGAPFHTALGFGDALKNFFKSSLHFRISGSSPAGHTPGYDTGTVLPMFDVLTMISGGHHIDFGTFNPTPENYADAVNDYFNGLGLFGGSAGGMTALVTGPTGPSMPEFVFADFYLMLMRQVVTDLLRDAISYEKQAEDRLHRESSSTTGPTLDAAGAFIAAVDQQQELNTLLSEYKYANAAGFSARFLLGGTQLPDPALVPPDVTPESARSLKTAPLYILTGQQVPASLGSPHMATAELSLTGSPGMEWITFEAGDSAEAIVDLPDTVPPMPAPAWYITGDTAGSPGRSADGTITYAAMPALTPIDLAFTVRQQTVWNGPSSDNIFISFPAPMMSQVATGGFFLQMHATEKTSGLNGKSVSTTAPDADGTAALVFSIPVLQVDAATATDLVSSPDARPGSGGSPETTGIVPFLYQVGATDDASRDLIHQAMQNPDAIGQISLLFEDGEGDGLTSEALSPLVLLTRTNLSTENQAKDVNRFVLARFAATAEESNVGLLTDPEAFLRLLWEVSVVNADGYYLFYRNEEGNGLPASLFQDTGSTGSGGTASIPGTTGQPSTLTVVVEFKAGSDLKPVEQIPIPKAANAVVTAASNFSGRSAILEVLDNDKQPIVAYQPAYSPGDLGFTLSWSDRPDDSGETTVPVSSLYHLIQFQVQPPGSPADEAWSLPLNPAAPPSAGSPGSSPEDDYYSQVFPAYRFLNPGTGSPGVPSPVASPEGGNWYDLVGQSIGLEFRLTDIFGNPLPPGANAAQTGTYNDPLIGLGQWPMVQANHVFKPGTDGNAVLTVALVFDSSGLDAIAGVPGSPTASPVSPAIGSPASNPAQKLAAIDARFRAIAYQLQDPGTSFTLTTPLAAEALETDPRGHLLHFVCAIRSEINAAIDRANANMSPVLPSPVMPITTSFSADIAISGIGDLPANIGAVTVSLSVSRDPADTVPDAEKLLPAVISSTSEIPPLRIARAPDNGSTDTALVAAAGLPTDSHPSIAQYAVWFEEAFKDYDCDGGMLKLAERAGMQAQDASQDAPSLWYVRFAGEPKKSGGINAAFTGDMTYYALRPLNTNPVTVTQNGKTYNDADMDAWARDFFEAVDQIFEPKMAAAIALLDEQLGQNNYHTLVEAKTQLANNVPARLSLILEETADGDREAAQTALTQAMLESLSSAYTVSVVAQAEANVSVIGFADETSPSKAPEFFGKVGMPTGGSPSSPVSPSDDGTSKVFTISPGRLDAAQGTQWTSVLVSAADPAQQTSLTLPLSYDISFMQHDFEVAEEQDGFIPSTWLKFVLPGGPALTLPITGESATPHTGSPGEASIPIPLPFEPPSPVLVSQGTRPSQVISPAGDSLSELLEDALKWTYVVSMSTTLAAQDTLFFSAAFNSPAQDRNQTGEDFVGGAEPGLAALFQNLAAFRQGFPAFAAAEKEIFAAAYGKGSPSGDAQSAGEAIRNITNLINAVAMSWPGPIGELAMIRAADHEIIDYNLRLKPDNGKFTVTFQAKTASGENPDIWPEIQSSDGSLDWTPDRNKAVPTDGWYELSKTFSAPREPDGFTLTWHELNLHTRQTASFTCHTVRNAELVEGFTTNEDFIYTTDEISFDSAAIPLIIRNDLPLVVPKQDETLGVIVNELLTPLSGAIGGLPPVLNLQADFAFSLVPVPDGGSPLLADMPILMIDDLVLAGSPSPGMDAQAIAEAISDWHTGFKGQPATSYLDFNLTFFAVVAGQQLPVVEISPIRIDVSSVDESWWQA